jgi:pantetheine-phosphate adenylyltransferase
VHRVVCPGSFDPVTNGHLDIIGRASGLYDEVIVAVLINVTKRSLFTVDERVEMLGEVTARYGNVKIDRFHGLLVDFCAANGITAVIKGLRAVTDFEYEMQMAQMNYRLAKVETLFMTTNPLYSFLSSSLVKEIARYGGDVGGLVPEPVLARLRGRLAEELKPASNQVRESERVRSSWDYPCAAGRLGGRFRNRYIHEYTVMPNTRTNAPRGALVFDMRTLGRQAGSAKTQQLTVPAPDDMRLELARVPVGADLHLDVRFEAVTEGVLVTGSATAPLAGECARCLTPLATVVSASFRELYLYQRDKHDKHERFDQNDEQDEEELYLDGDLLDLEPVLRDAVVLALPMSPLCREDCPGLCVECGVPLADAGPGHKHDDAPDPRWAGLSQYNLQEG